MKKFIFFTTVLFFASIQFNYSQNCVKCHKTETPNIVTDWELSKHSENDVDCSICFRASSGLPLRFTSYASRITYHASRSHHPQRFRHPRRQLQVIPQILDRLLAISFPQLREVFSVAVFRPDTKMFGHGVE